MADFNKKDFDPKAAAEERKAEMEQMTSKLEKGVKDIFASGNFKKYLDFCAKLPRYSINNQILIMLQKPEATMCQSYTGWKDMNRFVRKGEKGIRIFAPAPYKMQKEQEKTDVSGKVVVDKDGEPVKEKVEITVNAFKPVSTFDVSQTEGDPVPTVGVNELTAAVEGYESLLNALKEVIPVPVSFEQIDSGAKGFYHLEENRIVVQEGMSEAQTVKTLVHEASHQALHSKEAREASGETKSKNQQETEAESIAYVVCQHYGIDTSEYSFPYVATWSADKEVPELKASLETIRSTASWMITKIDEKMQEMNKENELDDIIGQIMEVSDEGAPFDQPEVHQPEGFMTVEPPVELSDLQKEQDLSKSADVLMDMIPGEKTEVSADVKAEERPEVKIDDKAAVKAEDKTAEKAEDKADEKKEEKKTSIKEKLAKVKKQEKKKEQNKAHDANIKKKKGIIK